MRVPSRALKWLNFLVTRSVMIHEGAEHWRVYRCFLLFYPEILWWLAGLSLKESLRTKLYIPGSAQGSLGRPVHELYLNLKEGWFWLKESAKFPCRNAHGSVSLFAWICLLKQGKSYSFDGLHVPSFLLAVSGKYKDVLPSFLWAVAFLSVIISLICWLSHLCSQIS